VIGFGGDGFGRTRQSRDAVHKGLAFTAALRFIPSALKINYLMKSII
jgi:hypothetical protein